MKNKTYQMKPISFGNSSQFVNYQLVSNDGKKRLSKQTGAINQLLMILIIGGLGYGASIAENKGLISFDKTQIFVSKLSDRVSDKLTAENSDFRGYGVQLVATKQFEQAKGIMNDFARDGYSAFVVASETNNNRLYKVRLGPYSNKPEAIATQGKVVRRYPNNPYVKSSLVIYKPN